MESEEVPALRRSLRYTTTSYESNGRDYLAAQLEWSRERLEAWILSDTVNPHLRLWYNLCLRLPRRYNSSIEWINNGSSGYFYDPSGLEEDLLLVCLGKGNVQTADPMEDNHFLHKVTDENVAMHTWSTQEIWARTAWRIVQHNRSNGQVFEHAAVEHPVFAYAFTIDLLCIAFHSVAFRGKESVWDRMITDCSLGLRRYNLMEKKESLAKIKMTKGTLRHGRVSHSCGAWRSRLRGLNPAKRQS